MTKYLTGFLFSIISMLVIGVLMLFSTGAYARDAHGDPYYFIKRQLMWLAVGVVVCCITACIDYRLWKRFLKPLFIATALLLAACFLFREINGAQRWIRFGGFSLQPSEIAKITAMVFLASWLSDYKEEVRNFWKGFVLPLGITGILIGLIAAEVDLGTAALISAASMVVMFIAGTRWVYLGLVASGGLAGLIAVAVSMPQRLSRLVAFMDLEAHKSGAGHQQYEGLIALVSGGLWGLGLGNGRQKMFYLPFAHTDFIFPMIGEELGLVCVLFVIFTYILLLICGISIAMNASDLFGTLLASGLVSLVGIQAALNIAVTTAMLPNKGIALPFISYGGSSLVFSMAGVGLIINIYRQGATERSIRMAVRHPLRTASMMPQPQRP